MNPFRNLWNSTQSFYQRFNVENTSVLKRQRIFMEEVLEFLQASSAKHTMKTLGHSDMGMESQLNYDLLAEAADVIVTVQGVLMAHGFALEELEAAMNLVAIKNNSKTHESHYKDPQGKISRRVPTP